MKNDLITIQEAAELLSLHPQTIYRKCWRGEIPCIRYGRTLRIPLGGLGQETQANEETQEGPKTPVPSFMKGLFWEYRERKLTSADRIVVERVLQLGNVSAWRWLKAHVPSKTILVYVKKFGPRRLEQKSFSFWLKMLGDTDGIRHPAETATETLGKTRWR